MPSLAEMNSATSAPDSADAMASRSPAMMTGMASGTTSLRKVCHLLARIERKSSSACSFTFTTPESVLIKGATVGLVSDRDRAFLQMALGTAGLTLNDVETVVVGEAGPTLANAFRNQSVSAISGAVPDWLAIQANGIPIRMITPEELLASPANTFAMNADRVEEMRPTLEGFLRAWTKGMYVAEVDPDVAAEMAKRAVPEEWENEQFGREFLDASIGMNLSETEQLGDIQPEVWAEIQPRYVEVGILDEVIDPSTFLNDTYIDAANDWDRAEVEAEVKAWKEENM